MTISARTLLRRGPTAVVVVLLAAIALAYQPYDGSIYAVVRPKAIAAWVALLALAGFAIAGAFVRARGRPDRIVFNDRTVAALLAVYLGGWLLSATLAWSQWDKSWDLLRYSLQFGLAVAVAMSLAAVPRALIDHLPWAGGLIAGTILLQTHGINPPGLPDDWVLFREVKVPAGTFVHRNTPAYLVAMAIPPCLWHVARHRRLGVRVAWMALAGLLLAALIATRSRGAWGALLLGLTVLAIHRRAWTPRPRRGLRWRSLGAVAGTCAVGVAVAGMFAVTLPSGAMPVKMPTPEESQAVTERKLESKRITYLVTDETSLADRANVLKSTRTLVGRFKTWRRAARLIPAAPIAGHGPGGFKEWALENPVNPYYSNDRVHNQPIEIAVDAGIPVAVAFVLLWLVALVRTYRARRTVTAAVITQSMLVIAGVNTCLEPMLPVNSLIWGLVVGACLSIGAPPRAAVDSIGNQEALS